MLLATRKECEEFLRSLGYRDVEDWGHLKLLRRISTVPDLFRETDVPPRFLSFYRKLCESGGEVSLAVIPPPPVLAGAPRIPAKRTKRSRTGRRSPVLRALEDFFRSVAPGQWVDRETIHSSLKRISMERLKYGLSTLKWERKLESRRVMLYRWKGDDL